MERGRKGGGGGTKGRRDIVSEGGKDGATERLNDLFYWSGQISLLVLNFT